MVMDGVISLPFYNHYLKIYMQLLDDPLDRVRGLDLPKKWFSKLNPATIFNYFQRGKLKGSNEPPAPQKKSYTR